MMTYTDFGRDERALANTVPCPHCDAPTGETCWWTNPASGKRIALQRVPAHPARTEYARAHTASPNLTTPGVVAGE